MVKNVKYMQKTNYDNIDSCGGLKVKFNYSENHY